MIDMPTLKITRDMLDGNNTYVGPDDAASWMGHIEIAEDLGYVRFRSSLRAKGLIRAHAGSGIKAGWGIEAGYSISAQYVSCKLRIFAGLCSWRLPTPDEVQVRAEILSGTLAFGELVKADETAASE